MNKRVFNIIIGPVLFALCIAMLPTDVFQSFASKASIGTVLWMAYWWVTGPVDYAVTAFLPIAINAIFSMTDMSTVIANYASETIMLLLGASILTVSWEITGLDKRIAIFFLRLVGSDLKMQIIFWFTISVLLSTVLPNAVVCATITPIAIAMLTHINENDIPNSKVGMKILLTIAYATGLGGLASPLGGAMNLVTVEYLQQISGEEYMYLSWVIRFLPIMIVLIVCNLLFLLRDVKKNVIVGGTKEYFAEKYESLGKMSFEEKAALILFVIATVLAFARKVYQTILPGLKPAYVFIICAALSFLITNRDGERLIIWKSVQKKIVWELMYIFSGGLAAGTLIKETGAAEQIGLAVSRMNLDGGVFTVFGIITVTILLSDITSNTATAAVAMPIVISVINGIGRNPIPYIYIASVGVNLSYMLPTSIRAIPVGYGLQPRYMLKEGWKITAIVIGAMTIMCTLLLKYWELFSST